MALQNVTNNIKYMNNELEILKKNFPHCFDKEGNFQLEKFKNNLIEKEVNFSSESYGLDWLGKSYARLLASDPATSLLKADETHNSKPENVNSRNLLIKGDNLEVLKHLVNAYYEQVKMIYIDPPYNTGNDGFVYEDDRKFTVKELQNLIGIDEEKAKRILDFTQKKSNSHSAWLTFIYPRLYIAKQLLKDDGVIFVSIDDNEVAQLRLLMDEIFGEENFVAEVIWQRKRGRDNSARWFSKSHEYILVYAKYKEYLEVNLLALDEETKQAYKNQENDERGEYRMLAVWSRGIQGGVKYNFTTKDGVYFKERLWLFSKENLEKMDAENRLIIRGENIYRKLFLHENNGKIPETIWANVSNAANASEEIKELFNGIILFGTAKPTPLLKEMLKISTDSNDLILDFFSGSGTTGDAVMQLNADDGGNRKYILVQIPEPIDPKKKESKAAYDFVKNELKTEPTIFEITKERLLRAANKINLELDSKIEKLKNNLPTEEIFTEIEKLERCKTQNNFKIFETIPIWDEYDFEAVQFDSTQTLFDVGKLSEEDIKALLITWKTYDGIPLTQDLESIDLSGYTSFYGNGKLYLMNKGFTTNCLKALLEKIDTDKHFEPKSIIAFGFHFESKSLREISENIKTYNNKKKSDIDFIIRY